MARRKADGEEPEEVEEEDRPSPEEVTRDVTATIREEKERGGKRRDDEDEVSTARRALMAAQQRWGLSSELTCLGCGRRKFFAEEADQVLFCLDCWHTVTRRE